MNKDNIYLSKYLVEAISEANTKKDVVLNESLLFGGLAAIFGGVALGAFVTNKVKNYFNRYKMCNGIMDETNKYKCQAQILNFYINELKGLAPLCRNDISANESQQRCLDALKKKVLTLTKQRDDLLRKAGNKEIENRMLEY